MPASRFSDLSERAAGPLGSMATTAACVATAVAATPAAAGGGLCAHRLAVRDAAGAVQCALQGRLLGAFGALQRALELCRAARVCEVAAPAPGALRCCACCVPAVPAVCLLCPLCACAELLEDVPCAGSALRCSLCFCAWHHPPLLHQVDPAAWFLLPALGLLLQVLPTVGVEGEDADKAREKMQRRFRGLGER